MIDYYLNSHINICWKEFNNYINNNSLDFNSNHSPRFDYYFSGLLNKYQIYISLKDEDQIRFCSHQILKGNNLAKQDLDLIINELNRKLNKLLSIL